MSLLPFLMAAVLPPVLFLAARWRPAAAAALLALVSGSLCAWFLSDLLVLGRGGAVPLPASSSVALGFGLSFLSDGLGLLFAALVSGIGAGVAVYARHYVHEGVERFYAGLSIFMAAMLGLVLSDNLVLLFICWEWTSLASYYLIAFNYKSPSARHAALVSLLVTAGGGLIMLAGLVLLGEAAGTYSLYELMSRGDFIRAHSLYPWIAGLIIMGAFTKSAQFPFHFWLPQAMEAPTPASAYLHSATLVKAGVYLLCRMTPILGGTILWERTLVIAGALTMAVSGLMALRQTVLKRLLAYSTTWALGALVLLVGLGKRETFEIAMLVLVAHALYKSTLFLVAGALDHQTHTKDAEKLSGLRRAMPFTAAAALLAAISMGGVPPSIGFMAKEYLIEANLHSGIYAFPLVTVVILSGMAIGLVTLMTGVKPFFLGGPFNPSADKHGHEAAGHTDSHAGHGDHGGHKVHEAPPGMWLPPLILASLGLLFGLAPGLLADNLLSPAASAVLGRPTSIELHLWHGFNLALFLGLLTMAGGIAIYKFRAPIRLALNGAPGRAMDAWGPATAMDKGLESFAKNTKRLAHGMQHGYLRFYSMAALAVAALFTLWASWAKGLHLGWPTGEIWPHPHEVIVIIMMGVAAVSAAASRSRLLSIAALGMVGYGVTLLFAWYGAPDLAITQLTVEVLSVILLLLVFKRLPQFRKRDAQRGHTLRDVGIATFCGLTLFIVLMGALTFEPPRIKADWFGAVSKVQAHGGNIVNVILVDFRAFDTMGEITVLAAAAIGIMGLASLKRRRRPTLKPIRPPSPLLKALALPLQPIILLVAIWLMLRGHNAPGGGFIGGLVFASAFILRALAVSRQEALKSLGITPVALLATGLICSLSSGVLAATIGSDPFHAMWGAAVIPGLGELHIGTPLLFDIGVFLTVTGFVLQAVFALWED